MIFLNLPGVEEVKKQLVLDRVKEGYKFGSL